MDRIKRLVNLLTFIVVIANKHISTFCGKSDCIIVASILKEAYPVCLQLLRRKNGLK